MPRKPDPQIQHRTAWHPLFLRALLRILPRRYFQVNGEYQLNWQPLRLDAVIVRKRHVPRSFHPAVMAPLVQHLGDITLIQFKGATAKLDWRDLPVLLAGADLYCASEGIKDHRKLRLMVVSGRLTPRFVQQVQQRRGKLTPLGPGVTRVRGLPYVLYGIETEVVSDHALHVFSRSFVQAPRQMVPLLSDDERAILREVFNEAAQFRQDPNIGLRYPDYEEVVMSQEEFAEAMMQQLPPEKRLKGLSPRDRLKGLTPRDRVEGLAPEDRLEGLTAEDRLEGLTAEDRLEGLTAEDRLEGLSLKDRKRLLQLLQNELRK